MEKKYYEENINLIAEHTLIATRQSKKMIIIKAMFKEWGFKRKEKNKKRRQNLICNWNLRLSR